MIATAGAFVTGPRAIDEADVDGFAALTGDEHPQHVDAEWAATSRFGERVAHGLLVLSAAAGSIPFDPERVVALRRVRDVVFKAPVALGDTIRVEGETASKRELDPDHRLVEVRLKVRNQLDRLVMLATLEVIWRTEAEPGGPH